MKTFLLTLLCLAASFGSFAAVTPSYQRVSLNHNDGLCDDYVRHIGQDAHGYVWVVTNHGLNRFDGNGFKRFTKENSGLTTNELNCVLQDPYDDDLLWIGSRLDGLFCYDHASGRIVPVHLPLKMSDITALSVSSDRRVWITHYNCPPEKFDTRTKELEPVFKSVPDSFPTRIWCSVVDHSGHYMYLGHESFGLTKIDLVTKEHEEYPNFQSVSDDGKGRSVYSLHIDGGGCVWIGADNGVFTFDPVSSTFMCPEETTGLGESSSGPVKALRAMDDGVIWAGTPSGISLFSPAGRRRLQVGLDRKSSTSSFFCFSQLSSSDPSAIFEDSYGNKWVGYNSRGLDVLNRFLSPVSFYFPTAGDGRAQGGVPVWSILVSAGKDIWIGGERSVANVKGNAMKCYPLPLKQSKSAPVRCMYEDNEETIWLGTHNSGAFRKRKNDAGFCAVSNIDMEVRAIVEADGGGIVAATHNGIYRIGSDGIAAPAENLNVQMPDFYVTALLRTSAGGLLAGTFGHGIVAFDEKGRKSAWLDKSHGLPSSTVNDIKESPDHRIWIATRDGIAVCDPSGLRLDKVIRTEDGVHSSNFKSIEFDKDGKVWISAEDGISCYDSDAGHLSFYPRANKALLGGFVEGASAVSSNGNVMFGSLNGMNILDPDLTSRSGGHGNTRVTELLANDSDGIDHDLEISLPVSSGVISIPYHMNNFTIKFSNPDISASINSEIRYNMEGVNNVWTAADGRNEAVYRNLKPGKYKFRISTRYFGGEWSAPETLLTVTITPPLYLTWWAMVLYAVLFIFILWMVLYSHRYKVNLEKNLEIERENSRINRLLNEEKLMFYTNVTHELRTPLSLIIGPIEDLITAPDLRDEHRRKLHTIRSSSIRLLNLINGILEFRKTETSNRQLEVTYGNLANFVREIALRFKELNYNRNVSFVIDVSQMEDRDMYYDPKIITTVLNNLIGNAAKFTREGTITVTLRPACHEGVDYVDLIVADTGEGIDSSELPHIFKRYYQAANSRNVSGTGIGLALVKSLVELHEAEIDVRSEVGNGSIFTVRFLADNSYPSARHKESVSGVDWVVDVEKERDELKSGSERLSVLVVEDDEDVRAYIETSLSDVYHVITATDGESGWNLVLKEMPDIVVSDIMMPKINGIELCRRIKNDDALSHIPVILLTAKDSLLDKEEGYESGADSYITKPFSSKLLLSRIHNLIEARHRLSIRYIGMMAQESLSATAPDTLGQEQKGSEEAQTVVNGDVSVEELPAADKEFIDRFRKLIEENIEQQELDIAFLTDRMCMSHSTLYRKVKSITGLTPNEFTRKIKLARAVRLLLAGEKDIAKVTDMTGFNSPSYFRRVFKKEFGLTPTEYIEQNCVICKNNPT